MVINIQDKQSQHKAMSAGMTSVIDDQLSSEEKILKSSVDLIARKNFYLGS